jgi:phosphoglycolate phosphatase-like HAD superfamily hydrolase
MSPIKCVLFDLDNTLIDIPDLWNYFDNLIVEVMQYDLHLAVPVQSERDRLWRTGKDYIPLLRSWGLSNPQEFWNLFDKRDELQRVKLIEHGLLVLNSDVIPLLDVLKAKHLLMGVITNAPTSIAKLELDAYNISSYFSIIFGLGEKQEWCKPEPDGIIQVLSQLRCKSFEAVYIGDSTVDLIAAKRAKVLPILIDRTKKKQIESKDISNHDFLRVSSLTDIPSIIKLD